MSEFAQVKRTSVSAAVFEQIAAQILDGTLSAGSALPSERNLTEAFGVNRQALREALQRLDQLGLVEIRHGDATRILDYRQSAGLDLLPRLFLRADGAIDPLVVRSVMEMRSAIGSDAAALCAERASAELVAGLRDLITRFEAGEERSALDSLFWDLIVDGSDNVCYRLSLNALREAYRPAEAMVHSLLTTERGALDGYRAVVEAIAAQEATTARTAAAELLALGTEAIKSLFTPLEEA